MKLCLEKNGANDVSTSLLCVAQKVSHYQIMKKNRI